MFTLRRRSSTMLRLAPVLRLAGASATRGLARGSVGRVAVARGYASLSNAPTPYDVFDEAAKARQRDRAVIRAREAVEAGEIEDVEVLDYLREETADRIAERVEDLKTPPAVVLDLSSHAGQLTKLLQDVLGDEGGHVKEGKRRWIMVDQSWEALNRDKEGEFLYPVERIHAETGNFLADPTIDKLMKEEVVDCVVSAGGLQWVGDIVGAFTQVRHLLKPDGVFIGAVLGGDTLFELRTSLQLAEQERRGGIANRVSPMVDPKDAPSLLSRAGFTTTTVDTEDITINYPSMWELISDLRDMGESNAILGRRAQIPRDVLLSAASIYQELYGNEDGSVPATFSLIWMVGWKPGPNAPKPLERGSAKASLKDVL